MDGLTHSYAGLGLGSVNGPLQPLAAATVAAYWSLAAVQP